MNERFERPQRKFGNRENKDHGRYGGDNRHGFHQQPPVKVDDELDVRIEAVGEKGDGVAKKDGFVLFIPGVKEGEEVKVKITRVLRKVGFAEVIGRAEGPIVKDGNTDEVEAEPVKEAEPDYSEENDSEDFGEDEETETTESDEETEDEVPKAEEETETTESDEETDDFAEDTESDEVDDEAKAEEETETTEEEPNLEEPSNELKEETEDEVPKAEEETETTESDEETEDKK